MYICGTAKHYSGKSYCMNLHAFLSKCLKVTAEYCSAIFSFDNAECTKAEQNYRTCHILQTSPHTFATVCVMIYGSNFNIFPYKTQLARMDTI